MKDELLDRFLAGETLAAARVMSAVERGGPRSEELLDALYPRTGRARRIALTGGTGSGKSTLASGLVRHFRSAGSTVGVVAEDPTSPFSGGAVLGDRIRMVHAMGDPGVFVRSVASRGSQTGFSVIAGELADVLDAFGSDVILMETIGVGQLEHRIRHGADTTVVVATPESGDEVQSLKSGLMEIGDIFVVNKADRPGAEAFARDLTATLELRDSADGWSPPVLLTVASEDRGLDDLGGALAAHEAWLAGNGRLEQRRRDGLRRRIRDIVEEKVAAALWRNRYIASEFDGIFDEVLSGRVSPYRAAGQLVAAFARGGGEDEQTT